MSGIQQRSGATPKAVEARDHTTLLTGDLATADIDPELMRQVVGRIDRASRAIRDFPLTAADAPAITFEPATAMGLDRPRPRREGSP